MGRVMGILGVQQLLGPVLGPVIGGVLVEHGGWRWIFYVNVPIGALAIPLAAWLLPREAARPRTRFDGVGFLLDLPRDRGVDLRADGDRARRRSDAAGRCADPGRHRARSRPLSSTRAGARRSSTSACFAGARSPPASARRSSSARACSECCSCCRSTYQGARGASPLDAGLLLVPQGIGAAIMMPLAGRITDRAGPGAVVLGGLGLILAGTLPFAARRRRHVRSDACRGAVRPRPGHGRRDDAGDGGRLCVARRRRDGPSRKRAQRREARGRLARRRGLAVVLEHGLAGSAGGAGERAAPTAAGAFANTFWWVFAFCALAFIPAAFLPRRPAVEGGERAEQLTPPASPSWPHITRPRTPSRHLRSGQRVLATSGLRGAQTDGGHADADASAGDSPNSRTIPPAIGGHSRARGRSAPRAPARTHHRRDRCRRRCRGSVARSALDVVEHDRQRSGNARPRPAGRDREGRRVGVALGRPDRGSDRSRLGSRPGLGRPHRHEPPRHRRCEVTHRDDLGRQALPGQADRLVRAG